MKRLLPLLVLVVAALVAAGVWSLRERESGEPGDALSPDAPAALSPGGRPGALSPTEDAVAEAPQDAPEESARAAPEEGRRSAATAPRGGDASIFGRVTFADGTPAVDARVLAWPADSEPPYERVRAILRSRSGAPFTTTDSTGSFRIDGLQKQVVHSLIVGGPGLLGLQPRWRVLPGGGPGGYRARRLYGARLELREAGGGAPRGYADVYGPRAGRTSGRVPGILPVIGRPPGLALAGVELPPADEKTLASQLLLYTSDEAAAELGPLTWQAEPPGYEPLSVEFHVRDMRNGALVATHELRPLPGGFGAVRLEVVGWRGPCPPYEDSVHPPAVLRLKSPLDGSTLCLSVGAFDEDGALLEGVPRGPWRAKLLRARGGAAPIGDPEVGVPLNVGEQTTTLRVNLAGEGSLRLHVFDADGEPWEAGVTVSLSPVSQASRLRRSQSFNAPPYRLDGLTPGVHELVLLRPFPAGTSVEQPRSVTISGGTCAEVELRQGE